MFAIKNSVIVSAVRIFLIMISSLLPCWIMPLHGQSADTASHDPIYFQIPASPINHLTDGTILAMAHDADGEIIGCALYAGELPPGVVLGDDGTFVVISQEKLTIGTYPLEILTVDEKGGISGIELVLTFLPKGLSDAPSRARVLSVKPLHAYKRHDVIVQVRDLDGPIVRTQFVKGELPPGTFLTQNGKILVDDPEALKPGIYDFILLVQDQKGGAGFISVTLPLSAGETEER